MNRLLVALAAALMLPSAAQAADNTILYLNPTKVAPGWTLGGSVASGSFYSGTDDVLGLTLTRRLPPGRAAEKHPPRRSPPPPHPPRRAPPPRSGGSSAAGVRPSPQRCGSTARSRSARARRS